MCAEYEPCILTKEGFAEGCARYHVTRKDAGLRKAVNEFLLDRMGGLMEAALINADGKGDKVLTLEHLKAAREQTREFPEVLF
jgi:hypothetical protein